MVFKQRAFFGDPSLEEDPQGSADLESRVAGMLAGVQGLEASEIDVVASGTTITLSGFVASLEEIERAAEAAKAVEGVTAVDNRLTTPDRDSATAERDRKV